MRGIALLCCALSLTFAGDLQEGLLRLKKEGILSEEMMRMIEEYKGRVKGSVDRARKRAKGWEEGKAEGEGRKGTVYIFMSSSVPEEVWDAYMEYVAEKELPAVFLLRGCIGGCRYIRPTLAFIRKVLKGHPLEVWIDPIKFREYGVKVVPCVAVEGKEGLSCGDWNIVYHLRRLGW
ncbi:MAG TPA: hypothetical protein EYP11_00935 [Aquificaceae bacterium]|nr:hypothetical protein [Aquificaceae bacterium]